MKIQTPTDLAALIRSQREDMAITQQQLADMTMTSRKWVIDLENGKPTVELYRVLDVLATLNLELHISGKTVDN